MKKILNRGRDAFYAMAAAATVAIIAPGTANAQATVGDTAANLRDQVGNVGQLAVAGSFLVGLVMLATGLVRLKAAADTQGNQVKYGEGLWRIVVGAGLVAIPAFSGLLGSTFGFGDGTNITSAGGANF